MCQGNMSHLPACLKLSSLALVFKLKFKNVVSCFMDGSNFLLTGFVEIAPGII